MQENDGKDLIRKITDALEEIVEYQDDPKLLPIFEVREREDPAFLPDDVMEAIDDANKLQEA